MSQASSKRSVQCETPDQLPSGSRSCGGERSNHSPPNSYYRRQQDKKSTPCGGGICLARPPQADPWTAPTGGRNWRFASASSSARSGGQSHLDRCPRSGGVDVGLAHLLAARPDRPRLPQPTLAPLAGAGRIASVNHAPLHASRIAAQGIVCADQKPCC